MKDCRKRQVEKRDGEVIHRCINKKAEAYKLPVCESTCDSCPMRVFIQKKEQEKANTSLPVISNEGFPTCEYRVKGNGERLCGITGLPTDLEICNRCVKETRDVTPTLMKKVVSYASAVRKWVAAGKPERTQEEIDDIYETHCSKCSMYDKVKKICNSCGCPATTDQPALTNKLRMATEECPLGRFAAKVKTNA